MPGPARLLPALPVLVRAVDDQRTTARSLLEAAARTEPGQAFTVAGVTLNRAATSLLSRPSAQANTIRESRDKNCADFARRD